MLCDLWTTGRLGGAVAAAAMLAALGGCGLIPAPSLPEPIRTPDATVEAVRRVNLNDRAAAYEVLLAFRNENDVALPMTGSAYELSVGGARYESDAPPNAVIPANGSIRIALPAVLTGGGSAGGTYEVSGSVAIRPPGQVRRTFYEAGWPEPRVPFHGRGMVAGAAPEAADFLGQQPEVEGQEPENFPPSVPPP